MQTLILSQTFLKIQADPLSQSASLQPSLRTHAWHVSSMTTEIGSRVVTHTMQIRKLAWKGVRTCSSCHAAEFRYSNPDQLQFLVIKLRPDLAIVGGNGRQQPQFTTKSTTVLFPPRNPWAPLQPPVELLPYKAPDPSSLVMFQMHRECPAPVFRI